MKMGKIITWITYILSSLVMVSVATVTGVCMSNAWFRDQDDANSTLQIGHGTVIKFQDVDNGTVSDGIYGWQGYYDSTKTYAYPGDKIIGNTQLLVEASTETYIRVKITSVVQSTDDGSTFSLVDLKQNYTPESINGVIAPADMSDTAGLATYANTLKATRPERANFTSDQAYEDAYEIYLYRADIWNKYLFQCMTRKLELDETKWVYSNGWMYYKEVFTDFVDETGEGTALPLFEEVYLDSGLTQDIQLWKVHIGLEAEAIQAVSVDQLDHPWHNDIALLDCFTGDWATGTYTISFNSNGGSSVSSISAQKGATVTLPTPTRTGYTFRTWCLDENCTIPYTTTTMPARDVTLYADWVANTYLTTLDANGGTLGEKAGWTLSEDATTSTKYIRYKDTYGDLPTPTRDGYGFVGWFTAASGGSQVTSTSVMSTASEHTLYAHWNAIFTTSGNTITGLTTYGKKLSEITIPKAIDGTTITAIENKAFYENTTIQSVKFAEDSEVTSIGNRAFYGCTSLTSVTFEGNGKLATINYAAFQNCSALEKMTIPSSLTYVDSYVFSGCNNLTYNIYDNAKYLGNFINPYVILMKATSTSITSCEIYEGCKIVYDSAFSYCKNLTGVTIPEKVTQISSYAFQYCTNLETVTISENSQLTSIGSSAFYHCHMLTSFTIPKGVTSINRHTFNSCVSLTEMTIPEWVNWIGDYAFNNCNGLTRVDITDLEAWCNITFDSYYSNPTYCAHHLYLNGEEITSLVIPSSITQIKANAFAGCNSLTSITIPSSVTLIDIYAFYNCSSLTSITIPSSVTNIGGETFSGCSGLTSINIPEGVTSIGPGAFSGCSGLTSVIFGENSQLTTIGYNAFYNCSSLTSIEIPSSVTSIGDSAFYNCNGLTSINIPSSVTSIGSYAFYNCSGLTSITIPSSVTLIGKYAFRYCSNLASIVIQKGLTSIGEYGFASCSGLTSITIPSSVKTIGNQAFNWCNKLTRVDITDLEAWCKITFSDTSSNPTLYAKHLYLNGEEITDLVIPSSITKINSYAFDNCNGLTSIEIPSSVTSIGSYAFSGCSGLTRVDITDLEAWCKITFGSSNANPTSYAKHLYLNGEEITNLVIPSSITKINACAFYNCSSLTGVTIPSSVTSIGSTTFIGCSGLESITVDSENTAYKSEGNCLLTKDGKTLILGCKNSVIPDSVESIGNYAFELCKNLTSITIPSSVTSIGEYAFYNCSSLTSVTFEDGSQLTSIGSYAFYYCNGLDLIYYKGTESDKADITIGNNAFYNCYATWCYYSEEEPATDGNFWRYVEGVPTVWVRDEIFIVSGGTITGLTDYGKSLSTIIIPNEIDGITITSIGYEAFKNNQKLTSVTIGSSVTTIGENAFYYCSKLKAVIIAENSQLDRIYSYAFNGCNGLTRVDITDLEAWCKITFGSSNANPTSYAKHLYLNGEEITNLVIPSSITNINACAFYNCSSLTGVTIPSSVTSIGSTTFIGCSGLTSITIPSSVTSIGSWAFGYCSGLTRVDITNLEAWCKITFSDSVSNPTNYAKHLYLNGEEITDLVIPSSITKINSYAFYNCNGLTSIEIPSSVTSIGNYAFYNCNGLTSINIPSSVTSIGSYAFYNCSGLTRVDITDLAAWCNISFGGSYSNPTYYAHHLYLNGEEITNLVIPSSITQIKANAFADCSCLTRVTIPDGVTSIGSSAFIGCNGLTSITIPEGVTSIGSYAFYECTALTEINFNATKCADLTSSSNVFYNAGISGDGITVTFCEGVIKIPAYLFHAVYNYTSYSPNINSVIIPSSLTSIGSYAFYGCSGLTSVTIPEGVTSIGSYAFYECTALTEIKFNARECADLTSSSNVFRNAGLSGDGITVTFGEGVTKIPAYLFHGSYSSDSPKVTSVTIASSATTIEEYAFYYCSNLKAVTIAENSQLTSIGNYAFYYCSGLITVTIPEGVTSIGNYAFYECTYLSRIYYGGATAEDWSTITINSNNSSLTSAIKFYYSATLPTDTMFNYWHYVDGVPTKW